MMIQGLKKNIATRIKNFYRKKELAKQFNQLKRNDEKLPDFLLDALGYLVFHELNTTDEHVVKRVESLRHEIVKNNYEAQIIYSPKPGSAGRVNFAEVRPEHGEIKTFDAAKIAYKASITQQWGTFLYLLSSRHKSKSVIELGSCAGISGSYLASNPHCVGFITIEGSSQLQAIAQKNIHSIKPDANVINGLFDDVLDRILPARKEKFDFAWIDGHHEKIATLHYFNRLKPYLAEGALVLFDDITWSQDMYEAWCEIKKDKNFRLTVNLMGQEGLGIWTNQPSAPLSIDFGTEEDIKISTPHGW